MSLWVSISDPAEEWPEWSQPLGAHDAYACLLYTSTINGATIDLN